MELKHIILGMLSIQPMSGYDLNRAFKQSAAHFWHADQSQIYRTLDRLTAEGMIDTEHIPQTGKPDRKVHSLSAAGQETLDAWLASPLDIERFKEPFLARLFFAGQGGPQMVEKMLNAREDDVRRQRDKLRGIALEVTDLPSACRAATLRWGLIEVEAQLAWLQEIRETVKEWSEEQ